MYESNYLRSKGELLALTYGLQKFSLVVVPDSKTVLH